MLYLMRNRIQRKRVALLAYQWFPSLPVVRQDVLVEMAFNLGIKGLLNFKKMIAAVQNHDWKEAVAQMKDSKWATQIGKARLDDLCNRMLKGVYD